MRIIPCIDIFEGKVVRLKNGNFENSTIYNSNPLEQAKFFRDKGFEWLHLVDLSATQSGKFSHFNTIQKIIRQTGLKIDVGGGIRDIQTVKKLIDIGAEYLNIGTLAVTSPELVFEWGDRFGYDKIVPSFDCSGNTLYIYGWKNKTQIDLFEQLKFYVYNGFTRFSVTDISRDGSLQGIDIYFFSQLIQQIPSVQIIAGGGISNFDDIIKLSEYGFWGVVTGKALYEKRITIEQIKTFFHDMQKNNTLP